jgi:hypothetical protein
MTSSSALPLAFALVTGLALLPATARGQAPAHVPTATELETARALYKEGKELRARGDLRGALEKLQAAHALGNTPVTGIELGRTYAALGQIVEAREVFLSIARLPFASDETEKSAEARSEAARLAEELQPRIPTLRVKVEGLGPGDVAHLVIDHVTVPDAAIAEPQRVDPGKHAVALRIGEGAASREVGGEVELTEGQAGEITLRVPAAPPVPPPPPAVLVPPRPRPEGAPLLVKLGFGTAIAGGAVGLIAGLTALNKKGQLAGECNAARQCDSSTGGTQDLDTARTWGNVSTVAFVIGGAGIGLGILGLVTGHGESTRQEAGLSPWLGLGAAGLDGRF